MLRARLRKPPNHDQGRFAIGHRFLFCVVFDRIRSRISHRATLHGGAALLGVTFTARLECDGCCSECRRLHLRKEQWMTSVFPWSLSGCSMMTSPCLTFRLLDSTAKGHHAILFMTAIGFQGLYAPFRKHPRNTTTARRHEGYSGAKKEHWTHLRSCIRFRTINGWCAFRLCSPGYFGHYGATYLGRRNGTVVKTKKEIG